jgi:sterol desaturase/sphingolipid hydroxylase (fatty acid hydroxylase superfamily)
MNSEGAIRLAFFAGTLAIVALWELLAPRRPLTASKPQRWFINLSMVAIDTVAGRLVFPLLPVGMAAVAAERGWGLLNAFQFPEGIRIIMAIPMLDFVIYLQHVQFHRRPLLWRLHRMHHTDLDLDVTSGNRFHPLEIIISLAIKMAAVVLIGAPPTGVLAFEVILNVTAMFSHGNIRVPLPLDRWLRLILVTPDMHRVHHSVIPRETDSNFGFCLPWWDRLLASYRDQPAAGHDGMTIGLKEYRSPDQLTLLRLLLMPFARQ